jgi:hypothetical protein
MYVFLFEKVPSNFAGGMAALLFYQEKYPYRLEFIPSEHLNGGNDDFD